VHGIPLSHLGLELIFLPDSHPIHLLHYKEREVQRYRLRGDPAQIARKTTFGLFLNKGDFGVHAARQHPCILVGHTTGHLDGCIGRKGFLQAGLKLAQILVR